MLAERQSVGSTATGLTLLTVGPALVVLDAPVSAAGLALGARCSQLLAGLSRFIALKSAIVD